MRRSKIGLHSNPGISKLLDQEEKALLDEIVKCMEFYKDITMARQKLLFHQREFSIEMLEDHLLDTEKIKLANEYLICMHYKFMFYKGKIA